MLGPRGEGRGGCFGPPPTQERLTDGVEDLGSEVRTTAGETWFVQLRNVLDDAAKAGKAMQLGTRTGSLTGKEHGTHSRSNGRVSPPAGHMY